MFPKLAAKPIGLRYCRLVSTCHAQQLSKSIKFMFLLQTND
jgi:hypothetical protein